MKVIRVILEAFNYYYEEMFHLIVMGALTFVCCLLILPGPFALAGLWVVAQRAIKGQGITWKAYWEGAKTYGLRTWLVTLIGGGGYALLLLNLWFYNNPEVSPLPRPMATGFNIVWLVLSFLWTGGTFYTESFLVEQEEPKVFLALRNSIYLTLIRPAATFAWVLLIVALLILSIVIPPLLLITPSFIAILSLNGLRTLVNPMIEAQEETDDDSEIR